MRHLDKCSGTRKKRFKKRNVLCIITTETFSPPPKKKDPFLMKQLRLLTAGKADFSEFSHAKTSFRPNVSFTSFRSGSNYDEVAMSYAKGYKRDIVLLRSTRARVRRNTGRVYETYHAETTTAGRPSVRYATPRFDTSPRSLPTTSGYGFAGRPNATRRQKLAAERPRATAQQLLRM